MAEQQAAAKAVLSKTVAGLDGRHRDKTGRLERRHNNTLLGHLRETYSKDFAPSFTDKDKLGSVLEKFGATSLSKFLKMKK